MKRKCADKNGATIVFAIGVFLVATVLSISIVGAALNSAKAAARYDKNQQANLAVSSAASYVKNLFDGCSYTYAPSTSGRDSKKYIVGYGESELGKIGTTSAGRTLQNNFKKYLLNANNNGSNLINTAGTSSAMQWNITSSVNGDPLKVKLFIMIVDNKNIKVIISDDNDLCSVEMLFVATVVNSPSLSSKRDFTWSYSSVLN